MKLFKKITAFALSLLLLAALLPAGFIQVAKAEDASGTSSDGLSWKVVGDTLTISGSGDMMDYDNASDTPWVKQLSSIKSIIVENGVTYIGDYAFSGLSLTTSISIAGSVTGIGNMALSGMVLLQSITLPSKLQSLGDGALSGCTLLADITIPAAVTEIGERCFTGCTRLETFKVASGNTHYKAVSGVLYEINGSELTLIKCPIPKSGSLAIPEGVTDIADGALAGCTKITAISIPASLAEFDNTRFSACTKLATLTVASGNPSYKAIDNVLYSKDGTTLVLCPGAKADPLNIAEGTTEIAENAISGASKIRTISLPSTYTTLDVARFKGCYCTKITVSEDNPAFSAKDDGYLYNKDGSVLLFVPGYTITSLTLPEGVNEIGDDALSALPILRTVTLPASMTTLNAECFRNCALLSTIKVAEGSTTFAADSGILFNYDMTELLLCPIAKTSKYTVPASVTRIADEAFRKCGILGVTLPEGLVSIGDAAFEYCSGYGTMTIPASVTEIGDRAFAFNVELDEIIVAEGNTCFSADEGVLYRTTDSVVLCCPEGKTGTYSILDGTTAIADSAFAGSLLTTINVPSSVTTIDIDAFKGAVRAKTINLQEGVESIGESAFSGCTLLQDFVIPSSVTYIGESAFSICTNLESITWPAGLTSVPASTFAQCVQLKEVYLPGTVTEIGESAFDTCPLLSDVYFDGTEAAWAALVIGEENDALDSAYIHCTDTSDTPGGSTEDSGETIDGLTWSVDSKGTLTISGNGAMTDYARAKDTPWNSQAKEIKRIIVQNGVTHIGDNAFYGLSLVTSVSLPNSVTSIGDNAFSGLAVLPSLTLPANLESLGDNALLGCAMLTEIAVPASLTEIGEKCFSGTLKLENISVAADNPRYRSINGALYEKTDDGLILIKCPATMDGEFNLPEGLVDIAEGAMTGCTKITRVTIPSTLTELENSRLSGCTKLEAIVVSPENPSYQAIDGALYTKDGETLILCPYAKEGTLTVAEGTTRIEENALAGCVSLETVSLPASFSEFEASRFSGCSRLTAMEVSKDNPYYSAIDGNLYNKDGTVLLFVPAGDITLLNSTLELPEGVKEIDPDALSACYMLTTVVIPASMTSIDPDCFQTCPIRTFEVAEGSKSFAADADYGVLYNADYTELILCPVARTGEVTVRDETKKIGDRAFSKCVTKQITLPTGLTTIGDGAFEYCERIEEIIIPSKVSSIGDKAFYLNVKLETIKVNNKNGYYYSDDGVLYRMAGAVLVACPEGKTGDYTVDDGTLTIADSAFAGSLLTNITLPDSVTTIGDNAFKGAVRAKSIALQKGVETIGEGAFSGCTQLSEITLPSTVTAIGESAFSNCSSLETVVIPDGVTSIPASTFNQCFTLKEVTIPAGVTEIGDAAFDKCALLTDVYFGGTEKEWKALTIGEDNEPLKNATIHCVEALIGDINQDGKVNLMDVSVLFHFCVSGSPEVTLDLGDLNSDGTISLADVYTLYLMITRETA